jgi:hypothetical protein
MLNVSLNKEDSIAVLEPHGALSKDDFLNAVNEIDPFIEKHGKLNGVIIYTELFPGWENFSALSEHLSFVRNHHKEIKRLAFVTNSKVGKFAEHISSHFIDAEIKSFPFDQFVEAKSWILEA